MNYEIESTEPTTPFDTFCDNMIGRGLWTKHSHPAQEPEAVIMSLPEVAEYPGESFVVLAKRFHNLGGQAIKTIIWQEQTATDEEPSPNGRNYIGAIGKHQNDSEPFCKPISPKLPEKKLWTILGAVGT